MPDTRSPKKVLYGQVKGRGVAGPPRKICNDILLPDTQSLNITCPHSDAPNKSAWKVLIFSVHVGFPVKSFMKTLAHSGGFYGTFLYLLACHMVYAVLYKP